MVALSCITKHLEIAQLNKKPNCQLNAAEPDGGPEGRHQVAGAARGAVRRAAAHGAGADPAEAALPLQLQHRSGIPQEQEGECSNDQKVHLFTCQLCAHQHLVKMV